MAKALDLIGKRFGRLTVIRNAKPEEKPKDKNGKPKPRTWCICKCDCGNEIITMATSLNTKNTTSCGCYQKEKISQLKSIDLIGKNFGKLTVIEKTEQRSKKGGVIWKCKCSCGNIHYATTENLNSGHVKSCGCLEKKPIKDITGQKFGKLTVLGLESKHEDGFYYWNCKCECGNQIIVRGNNLKTGTSQSCGCNKSRGEEFVNNFLINNNIKFKREYTFKDLLSNKQNPLKFDFCILDNNNKPIKIIEVNGVQHFDTSHKWYSEELVEYDKRKREYCKKHNILLLDLNYNKDNSIPVEKWKKQLLSFGGE